MRSITLTPPILILCITERYHNIVEEEQATYAQKLKAEQSERIKAHKERFDAMVEERKQQTEPAHMITDTGIRRAINTVKAAMRTGKLRW